MAALSCRECGATITRSRYPRCPRGCDRVTEAEWAVVILLLLVLCLAGLALLDSLLGGVA